jgi:hypothetical protein
LRFSAGIPLKVYQAASYGLPTVLTSQLIEDLGWSAGKDALVADTPAEFAEACCELYRDRRLWHRIRARLPA